MVSGVPCRIQPFTAVKKFDTWINGSKEQNEIYTYDAIWNILSKNESYFIWFSKCFDRKMLIEKLIKIYRFESHRYETGKRWRSIKIEVFFDRNESFFNGSWSFPKSWSVWIEHRTRQNKMIIKRRNILWKWILFYMIFKILWQTNADWNAYKGLNAWKKTTAK